MRGQVKVWVEETIIPTYPAGKPEKNPMFLEKRVYQGSSGVVYPHPVIEKIYDQKVDQAYQAVYLENQYLKIMILPELGGRVQMAYDKVKQRHFIYYNQVIKPALVGLTGPWISGGIEFNWPQHHRPSTFEPVDHTIEENADGSKTVWVNEVERMFRTKGMAGFTLHPDKAYLEIKGRLYNRTPFPQTFLWWANPAVKVNDDYQSIFPPDVYAVFDHGKRDVSSFPIAKGTYYKVNYAPGTDISRYKNIPVPTSYMAITSKYNFIGGYEHDTQGGLLHIANHHISPGKKQWTWGNGDFGKAWDRNLTDEDGPYIELMTGMFTDNQPDFSWLQPYEEKTFVQYFMPYREVGVVKNATKEAVAGIEYKEGSADIKLYCTATYTVKITLQYKGSELYSETVATSPETPWIKTVSLPLAAKPEEMVLTIINTANNKILLTYQQEAYKEQEIPLPASAAKRPADVENNEQLYLTGLHIEQYRHATYVATDYYAEALRRDENDTRNNNAMGLWYLRRGQFKKAEPYFRKAVATITRRNPNPYDGEPLYNLGLSLKLQGRNDEAYDAFYKCSWNDACQHAAYLDIARIAAGRGDWEDALELVEKSLIKNYHSHTARHLLVVVLRKLNRVTAAATVIKESLVIDPFNYGCYFEQYQLHKESGDQRAAAETINTLQQLSRNWVHNAIEYAFDYAHAGLYAEASELLQYQVKHNYGGQYPMAFYYLGYFAQQQNNPEEALAYYKKAAALSPDYCFPNRIEDVPVLQAALAANPADAKAPYYLGNYWYDKRQYEEAVQCWEASAKMDDQFPTVFRNLSLAYYNKHNHPQQSLAAMEKAWALDTSDARILMELDQLYKKLNTPLQQRLDLLEKHGGLVASRDDLYLERITLYNQLGQYQHAKDLIAAYRFHPWEGGEGKVVSQYLVCHLELAKQAIKAGRSAEALQLLEAAEQYPHNLGEGKLYGAQENDLHYLEGLAYEQLGNTVKAQEYYSKATEGIDQPVQAIFYNDPQPDKIFYQGLGWLKLHKKEAATAIFHKLAAFGKAHLQDEIHIDYFAVSLPDLLVFDSNLHERNRIHCLYLMGLGELGLGGSHINQACQYFDQVLQADVNHQGAAIHKQLIGYLSLTEEKAG